MTKAEHSGALKGHRFPPEIIAYAVWSYFRFPLSLRDVEDLLAARGIIVSYETIRKWVRKFGTKCAASIRRDRIRGRKFWLWRAIDSNSPSSLQAATAGQRTFSIFWFNLSATLAQRNAFLRKLFKQYGRPRGHCQRKLG